jgi:hypothetical protein
MRAIIIVVFANIFKIYESEISKSKIAIFVFILQDAEKRRQNNEVMQCLSRVIIAVLFANKNSYKNSFEFILNFIKVLQKKNVFA